MRGLKRFDIGILMSIKERIRRESLDKIMIFITSLGDGGSLWLVIAFLLFLSKDYKQYGELIICSLVMGLVIGNLLIKNIVKRRRPFHGDDSIVLLITKPRDFSFPSAHTMSSFASAVCIGYMNIYLGIIALIIASLIAFSRMYLYVHFPSDIFSGALIGIIIALISIHIVF